MNYQHEIVVARAQTSLVRNIFLAMFLLTVFMAYTFNSAATTINTFLINMILPYSIMCVSTVFFLILYLRERRTLRKYLALQEVMDGTKT